VTERLAACVAPSPTQCLAHTRLYRDGRLAATGFPVERLSDHLVESSTFLWVDLLQPTAADMAVLQEEMGLHDLAIEDALHAHQRPKLDRYPDHLFLATYATFVSGEEVQQAEVAAFITDRALVTVRKDDRVDLLPVLARWDDHEAKLGASGVAFLAHGLVDVLVDGYVDVARTLDERTDGLEDLLFAGADTPDDLQQRTFAIRSSVTELRRVVVPMREVVATMHRPDLPFADDRMQPYLRDVDDHVVRVLDSFDAMRDQLGTALDTLLAMQGQRLNETVFRLTAWAAILAATTAVTGYFGQNLPYPGLGEHSGLWASTVLLIGSTGGLFWYFKRKGWL
jgi:magnesium transporter